MALSPKKSLKKSAKNKAYKTSNNRCLVGLLFAVIGLLGIGTLVQCEMWSLSSIVKNSFFSFADDNSFSYGLPMQGKYFDKKHFIIYYNATLRVPNLVYEHQNKEHLTSCKSNRTLCEFFADPLLAKEEAAGPTDYYNSNYDRGHMATAHYHCKTQEEMCSSFVLTNIAPQLADLNRIHWQHLEIYLNNLLINNLEFGDVATGPIFYVKRAISYIKDGKIAVPHAFFKLVIGKCKGDDKFIAISFIAEHEKNPADFDFFKWLTTLENVEKLTGAKFFPKIDRTKIKQIKSVSSPAVDVCSLKN